MKKISVFSIPAHGHTNPLLPVVRELASRGNEIRFYSFDEFEEKIRATGAQFVSCSKYLPEITEKEQELLKKSSTTEMCIQDIRITLAMNDFLAGEFESFKPDIVYCDSACFWGKLNAWKFEVPMVVSTTTFAFNQLSSQYMKNSPAELADMIFGLPKISKELKTLEPYGYKVKNALTLVQSDNNTDSVVYASRKFQPYAESFSDHYAFVGPSVANTAQPDKKKDRPLVYISMGTVVNDKPELYKNCIAALKDLNADVIISYGQYADAAEFGTMPDNIKAYPRVDQLDILRRADVFLSHCGMNSASESLYMATPMVLFPQTGEQHAVARSVFELGSGVYLKDDLPESIRAAIDEVLGDKKYSQAAAECSRDFRVCPGAKGAADFVEGAPHKGSGVDLFTELNKKQKVFTLVYWLIGAALIALFGILVTWKYAWIVGVTLGILNSIAGKIYNKSAYRKLAEKYRK